VEKWRLPPTGVLDNRKSQLLRSSACNIPNVVYKLIARLRVKRPRQAPVAEQADGAVSG